MLSICAHLSHKSLTSGISVAGRVSGLSARPFFMLTLTLWSVRRRWAWACSSYLKQVLSRVLTDDETVTASGRPASSPVRLHLLCSPLPLLSDLITCFPCVSAPRQVHRSHHHSPPWECFTSLCQFTRTKCSSTSWSVFLFFLFLFASFGSVALWICLPVRNII